MANYEIQGLASPRILYEDEAFIGADGKLYETLPSYYGKMIKLGTMVANAVLLGEIKRPTRILSIPRGSLLPTDTVARMLGMSGDQILSYGLTLYVDEELNDQFRIGQTPPSELVEGEVVLIVDEVADTTKTLTKAKADVAAMNPDALYTAAVYDKLMPGTIRPDFAAAHTDTPKRWIKFPNEVFEDYGKLFIARMAIN